MPQPYIVKNPCGHWRLLEEELCPPEGVVHDISDYALFYTPLWTPQYFPEVFMNENTLCRWLEHEFVSAGFPCIVEMGIAEVILYFEQAKYWPLTLSFDEIASSRFYPPSVCHTRLVLVGEDVLGKLQSYPNPSWVFYSLEHVIESLQFLPFNELKTGANRVDSTLIHVRTKEQYACIIATKVMELCLALAQATTESLRAMCLLYCRPLDAPVLPQAMLLSRRGMISFIVGCQVGSTISGRLQIPPSYKYVPEALYNVVEGGYILDDLFGDVSTHVQARYLRKLSSKILNESIRHVHPRRLQYSGSGDSKMDNASLLVRSLRDRACELDQLTNTELRNVVLCWDPLVTFRAGISKVEWIKRVLYSEYGWSVMQSMFSIPGRRIEKNRAVKHSRAQRDVQSRDKAVAHRTQSDSMWPQLVPLETVHGCLNDYVDALRWKEPPVCAVCSRSTHSLTYTSISSDSELYGRLNIDVLHVVNPALANVMQASGDTQFWDIEGLDHVMLHHEGIHRKDGDKFALDICKDCQFPLMKGKMPRLALANSLYRGSLPEEFRDLTWVEEMVCCKHLSTAIVTRLTLGHGIYKSRKLRGNTCAHEMNIVSTARSLPRAPEDVNGMLSVVFIGPHKPDEAKLKEIFYVRREKVWRFLMWLKDNNELYADIAVDPEILRLYPEDGVLPGLQERIIFNETVNADEVYEEETAGIPEHASSMVNDSQSEDIETFIEKTGVSDAEVHYGPARYTLASGLRNLIPRGKDTPVGMEIYRGTKAIPEYRNSSLLPGMYPTLFPYGIGGFEDPERLIPVAFGSQANYYLDIRDRSFRYHHSFIFVVLNIIQRRTGHLYTAFTVSREKFDDVANCLNGISAETVAKLADIVEKEGVHKDLTEEEKKVLVMLKYVNTIATKVPGSAASKTLCRNEIRSYIGVMGAPQIFLTINPSPQHHPVFLLMYGDREINLNERYPELVPGPERAKRLAHDPVAAADFFDWSIRLILEHLFGWDFDKRKSSERGGILGRLKGFYGSAEYTERGVLHGHFLLWQHGGLNPSDVHQRMKDDPEFKDRFFRFFEDIIKHDLPDVDLPPGFEPRTYKPATEMPPSPLTSFDVRDEDAAEKRDQWESMFASELKACGEALQRHGPCKAVCHKYGNDDRCRFRFPHEEVEKSYFDEKDNAVIFRCADGMVNYHNPYMLVYCRHNHDIRCILSGRSAKAAMFYITDYITKMSLKTSQMLSLMCAAVMATPRKEDATAIESAKTLLHKCLSQFSKKQQIHAQQASRYLRGLRDSIASHETVPVMSNLAFSHVKSLYSGRVVREEEVGMNVSDTLTAARSPSTDTDGDVEDDFVIEDDTETIEERRVERTENEEDRDCDRPHARVPHEDGDSDEAESIRVKVAVDETGKVIHTTQLDDYLYRDERLRDVSFIDFVCGFKLEKKTSKSCTNRINAKQRFNLKISHPLAATHEIVERFLIDPRCVDKIYGIPRVVGMSIPRKRHREVYALFVFSHFVPFSADNDPISREETVSEFVEHYEFSLEHKSMMNNWDVIYECEDARDADRLAQQERYMEESRRLQEGLMKASGEDGDLDGVELMDDSPSKRAERDLATLNIVRKLRYARYLSAGEEHSVFQETSSSPESRIELEGDLATRLRLWDQQIQNQQARIASTRENLLHYEEQSMMATDHDETPETLIKRLRGRPELLDVSAVHQDDDASSCEETSAEGRSDMFCSSVKSTKVSTVDDRTRLSGGTPEEIMKIIKDKHSLNERQSAAFVIAARAWLEVHSRRVQNSEDLADIESPEPLRMLMTGPGGTGKSHSIKALKEFMEFYGSGHRLRLLAPTGSAASLIEGMTCHKGLGLKVKSRASDKKDIQRTSFNEQTELEMSIQKKSEMREAWKNIDVVLIDEVSLLSLQWLTEIDHALRMAKERPNEWFGGVIVIFSGDFCQYPPVGGNALFTSIRSSKRMTSSELKRRLGRLAWKTLNTVVEFTEQFRMKQDPEYAEAVSRLRLRKCTEEDVALFNSRVIKSPHYKEGVDMSSAENRGATMIVSTNELRERVNQFKAETECVLDPSKRLIVCNAVDRVDGQLVPKREDADLRSYVLNLRTAAHAAEGSLPGRIHLFEGMPVILRGRNIAVDLRIANGSQGFVYKIESAVDEYGFTYAEAVLVHFPDSPVQLSGLPKGVFPIRPVSWSFHTTLETQPGEKVRCKVRRTQLPIQPGYCVTGHSAQGKTLDKVLCDLSSGSWAAYVAVSRARRREDLYLLKHVTLSQLNRKLPHDLVAELKRYAAMEHNAMIKHGFKNGRSVDIPDAEDHHFSPKSTRYVETSASTLWRDSNCEVNESLPAMSPRPDDTSEGVAMSGTDPSNPRFVDVDKFLPSFGEKRVEARTVRGHKRKALDYDTSRSPKARRTDIAHFQGCTWDARNWSCSYDSVFMIFWLAYALSSDDWKVLWKQGSVFTASLGRSFDTLGDPLESPSILTTQILDGHRDVLRDLLSDLDSTAFPRYGAIPASVQEVVHRIMQSETYDLALSVRAGQENHHVLSSHRRRRNLWLDLYERRGDEQLPLENRHTHQCWINSSCSLEYEWVWAPDHGSHCRSVATTPFTLTNPPSILALNHTAEMRDSVLPVATLSIPTPLGEAQYHLSGIIYFGGNHFTARLIVHDSVYMYDGQQYAGECVKEANYDLSRMEGEDWASLTSLNGRGGHVYVYRRV